MHRTRRRRGVGVPPDGRSMMPSREEHFGRNDNVLESEDGVAGAVHDNFD